MPRFAGALSFGARYGLPYHRLCIAGGSGAHAHSRNDRRPTAVVRTTPRGTAAPAGPRSPTMAIYCLPLISQGDYETFRRLLNNDLPTPTMNGATSI
jgi:hypothetical protein